MEKIQIPKKNTPTNYFVVRVQLVHVKKGWLGLKDKLITSCTVIPDNPKKAVELTNRIGKLVDDYGVSFPL